jgi:hypothetical protein
MAEAETALNVAEVSLSSAYTVVLEASRAGADVSTLNSRLDAAGALIVEAYHLNQTGNYDTALEYASNCSRLSDDIRSDAIALKSFTENDQNIRVLWLAWTSIAELSVLLVLSLVVWRVVKKRYRKHVLSLRPEAK